eukprot:3495-Heterococcus_DN1.PRE.1
MSYSSTKLTCKRLRLTGLRGELSGEGLSRTRSLATPEDSPSTVPPGVPRQNIEEASVNTSPIKRRAGWESALTNSFSEVPERQAIKYSLRPSRKWLSENIARFDSITSEQEHGSTELEGGRQALKFLTFVKAKKLSGRFIKRKTWKGTLASRYPACLPI